MGIKIKNLQTGEFEKFNIPALKGEKGEPGEIEPSEKVDYIGKQHSKLRDTMNANVDYIIKTAIGEFNYLDYEGQHITATNSIEGHTKSAILIGQTSTGKNLYIGQDTSNTDHDWASYPITLEPNTYVMSNDGTLRASAVIDYETGNTIITNSTFTITTQRTVLLCGSAVNRDKFQLEVGKEPTDYEPYCLVSVKMPVLTTTGKNLIPLKEDWVQGQIMNGGGISVNSYALRTKSKIKVKPNTKYTFSTKSSDCKIAYHEWEANGKYIKDSGWITAFPYTFTTNNKAEYINLTTRRVSNVNSTVDNLDDTLIWQLEESSTATTYEPHKSNILHTPEEVVLSKVNDAIDTLNLNTKEYVKRVKEIVLDGSEPDSDFEFKNPTESSQTVRIDYLGVHDAIMVSRNKINCDRFLVSHDDVRDYEHIRNSSSQFRHIIFYINKSRLSKVSLSGFKEWLSQNPVTIQYELATPIIKTVDLSDNHVYSYKGTTHYSCSSEEGSLVPTLSVKVPTDTQLTIQEQKATTQTLLIKNMDLQQSIKEVQAMNLAFNTALYNSFNSIREEVEDIKKHVSTNENLEGSF